MKSDKMLVSVTAFIPLLGLAMGTDIRGALLKRSLQPGIAANAAWDGSTYRCPTGSNIFATSWCCPDGYEFDTNSGEFTSFICCPVGGSECSKQVLDCPICADSSWTYWDVGGTNVPPTLPFCCEQGYTPSNLQAPQPANVCTSGANLFTDYASASQCGNVADATGGASSATATTIPTANASPTATPTESSEGGGSTGSAEATASASASSGGSSGSGASLSIDFSNLVLIVALLFPGALMVMM